MKVGVTGAIRMVRRNAMGRLAAQPNPNHQPFGRKMTRKSQGR
jgi:hypothetical protein